LIKKNATTMPFAPMPAMRALSALWTAMPRCFATTNAMNWAIAPLTLTALSTMSLCEVMIPWQVVTFSTDGKILDN